MTTTTQAAAQIPRTPAPAPSAAKAAPTLKPTPKPASPASTKDKPAAKSAPSKAAAAKSKAKPVTCAKTVNVVPLTAVNAKATAAKKAVAKKVPVAGSAAHQEPAKAALASAAKPAKNAKKPKMVRDTFTIPKSEYSVLNDLKQRAAQLSQGVKKSELLRAGIKALAVMSEAAFLTALQRVPVVKTGRPAPSN